MGQHIVKQPNGKYAIFSSNVDHFIAYDATPEGIRELRRAEAIEESDRLTKRGLERAEVGGNAIFEEDIATVRMIHGEKVAEECEALLSGPQVECACKIGNGLHADWCPVYLHGMKTGIGFGQSPRTEGKEGPQQ